MNARRAWPIVVGASTAVTALIVYADLEFALRPVVVLWFLLVCPGMALIRPLRLADGATEVIVAVALSVALDTLVAGSVLYAAGADFEAAFTLLLVVTLGALAADLARGEPARQVSGR